ncbi:MAG: hypothetical protein ABSE15_02475 [Candidatus Bathyarchaeia archaeon]
MNCEVISQSAAKPMPFPIFIDVISILIIVPPTTKLFTVLAVHSCLVTLTQARVFIIRSAKKISIKNFWLAILV